MKLKPKPHHIAIAGAVAAGVIGIHAALPSAQCHARGPLQDPSCTPGGVNITLTQQAICNPAFHTTTVRNVPESEKAQVYQLYGIAVHRPGEYEVDHLISLELGGDNSVQNLWPEASQPQPGFHQKDAVENFLHKQVCAGKMTLPQAQSEIRTNWIQAYTQMTGQGPAEVPSLEGNP